MTAQSKKVALTAEIIGAIKVSHLPTEAIGELIMDPQAYIMAHADINLPDDIDLSITQNTTETVNLALPYYAGMAKHTAAAVAEDDLDDVSGGEFIIGIIAAVLIGGGVATTIIAVGASEGVKAKQNK